MADLAADGFDKITVMLVYGQERHKVTVRLPADEPGGVIMNHHLAEEVAKATGIPLDRQRLICKGKTLKDPYATVKEEGVTPGCKIMLIAGPRWEIIADPNKEQLRVMEQDIEKLSVKLSAAIYKVDGALRTDRKVLCISEKLTAILMKLDALPFDDNTDKTLRQKRKQLVDKIHGLLKQADEISEGVTEKIAKHNHHTMATAM